MFILITPFLIEFILCFILFILMVIYIYDLYIYKYVNNKKYTNIKLYSDVFNIEFIIYFFIVFFCIFFFFLVKDVETFFFSNN